MSGNIDKYYGHRETNFFGLNERTLEAHVDPIKGNIVINIFSRNIFQRLISAITNKPSFTLVSHEEISLKPESFNTPGALLNKKETTLHTDKLETIFSQKSQKKISVLRKEINNIPFEKTSTKTEAAAEGRFPKAKSNEDPYKFLPKHSPISDRAKRASVGMPEYDPSLIELEDFNRRDSEASPDDPNSLGTDPLEDDSTEKP